MKKTVNIFEIWCNGKLHYTRPEGHPDLDEARDLIETCKRLYGVSAYEIRQAFVTDAVEEHE